MSKKYIPKHKIQTYIIDVLMRQKYARFRDMRPVKADTNLYSYHLKVLQQEGFVVKSDDGYTLGKNGLIYANRNNASKSVIGEVHPDVRILLVIQNSNGDILLQKRDRQPFIDSWVLPGGSVRDSDSTIAAAAKRIAGESLQLQSVAPRHAGDCYIRILDENQVMMSTLVHVFRFETNELVPDDLLSWARPHKLGQYDLAPAVEDIVTRTFFNDPYFFEEYTAELLS